MDKFDDQELKAAHKAITGPAYVNVYYSRPSWRLPDGTVRGWQVLLEKDAGQPQWVLCYHEKLTKLGMHEVEFTRNSKFERTIRPWKG